MIYVAEKCSTFNWIFMKFFFLQCFRAFSALSFRNAQIYRSSVRIYVYFFVIIKQIKLFIFSVLLSQMHMLVKNISSSAADCAAISLIVVK